VETVKTARSIPGTLVQVGAEDELSVEVEYSELDGGEVKVQVPPELEVGVPVPEVPDPALLPVVETVFLVLENSVVVLDTEL
jgi:hypothetical protein